MKDKRQGVLTVEASIILTSVLLMILFLFGFAQIYRAQSLVSHAVLQASDAIAVESHLREEMLYGKEEDVLEMANKLTGSTSIAAGSLESLRSADLPKLAKEKFILALAKTRELADEKLKKNGIKNGIDGIDFSGSKMELDQGDVIVYATYTVKLKTSLFGMDEITITKAAKSKTFGEILFNLITVSEDETMGTASGGGSYKHGTEVTITAQPFYGYIFGGWDINGDGVADTSNALRQTVIVTGAQTYTALFRTDFLQIKLRVNNSAAGEIVKGQGACEYGRPWEIQASVNHGYSFEGWEGFWYRDSNGNGWYDIGEYKETVTIGNEQIAYTIPSVTGIYELTAKYSINHYRVTVENEGANADSRVVSQDGRSGTSLEMKYGSRFKLTTAVPQGYTFKGWKVKGESSLSFDLGTLTLSDNIIYVAVFEVNPSIVIYGGVTGGNTTQFTAVTVPSGVAVQWESSKANVATVSNHGLVTAVGIESSWPGQTATDVTITAYFIYNGRRYEASKKVTVRPSITVEFYCRRDGFNSSRPRNSTYGPDWWRSNGQKKKNTDGMRFYYDYYPGKNETDLRYGVQSVNHEVLFVTWSQILGAKTVGTRGYFGRSMIVHDTATTGPWAGAINPQVGYNAGNKTAYVFFEGNYDKIWFIKEYNAPRHGGGYHDYFISSVV